MQVAEGFTQMPAADIAALYIALIRFTAAVYPQRLDMVDQVLASCQEVQHQARSILASAPVALHRVTGF